jgi:hypothetical protein
MDTFQVGRVILQLGGLENQDGAFTALYMRFGIVRGAILESKKAYLARTSNIPGNKISCVFLRCPFVSSFRMDIEEQIWTLAEYY